MHRDSRRRHARARAEPPTHTCRSQYPPLAGVPELRQAVAAHSEREQGIPVDWATGGSWGQRRKNHHRKNLLLV